MDRSHNQILLIFRKATNNLQGQHQLPTCCTLLIFIKQQINNNRAQNAIYQD